MSLELHYGKCLVEYQGTGRIIFDGKKINCRFEAGQLLNGEIILLFISDSVSFFRFHSASVSDFEGISSEGYKLKSVGRIHEINYLPSPPPNTKGILAVRLNELSVRIKSTKIKSVCFGVTNFRFLGIDSYKGILSLPLTLIDQTKTFNVSIIPIENYEKIVTRLSTLKSIEPTCEIVADYQAQGGIRQLKKNIDTLCTVMSVARGTKVQWIYCNFYDDKGSCIRRSHFAHITKPYCPMPLIDYRPEGRFETKEFLEKGFEKFTEDSILDKAVMDTLLDARSEADYMELRAAKLGITLEKLKAAFVSRTHTKAKEFTINESTFQKLVPNIQSEINNILIKAGIDKDSRNAIVSESKIVSLNRRSFAYIIRKFCKEIGLKIKEQNLTLFIQCRNKLVHTGDFYCNTASRKEKLSCKPLATPREEYYFMMNFLDRIILKSLNYDGIYINYLSFMTGREGREKL